MMKNDVLVAFIGFLTCLSVIPVNGAKLDGVYYAADGARYFPIIIADKKLSSVGQLMSFKAPEYGEFIKIADENFEWVRPYANAGFVNLKTVDDKTFFYNYKSLDQRCEEPIRFVRANENQSYFCQLVGGNHQIYWVGQTSDLKRELSPSGTYVVRIQHYADRSGVAYVTQNTLTIVYKGLNNAFERRLIINLIDPRQSMELRADGTKIVAGCRLLGQ